MSDLLAVDPGHRVKPDAGCRPLSWLGNGVPSRRTIQGFVLVPDFRGGWPAEVPLEYTPADPVQRFTGVAQPLRAAVRGY